MKYIRYALTVLRHKFWTARYCFKAGLYWRGITHDLSKFSPSEFGAYARYFADDNPSDKVKAEFEQAWLHHQKHNSHHYEHWVINGQPSLMPFEDVLELVCNYLGAKKSAVANTFTYTKAFNFWMKKDRLEAKAKMHPVDFHFVEIILRACSKMYNCNALGRKNAKLVYDSLCKVYL